MNNGIVVIPALDCRCTFLTRVSRVSMLRLRVRVEVSVSGWRSSSLAPGEVKRKIIRVN